MFVRLKHVKPVKKLLASGVEVTYYYHRITKKRIHGEPGTEAFVKNYELAGKRDGRADDGCIAGLILEFRSSGKYDGLSDRSKSDYDKHLDAIALKFGACEIEAFNDRRIRGDIIKWRDELGKKSPRQADYAVAVMGVLLAWAYDVAKIETNHAARIGKLYESDRCDKIWEAPQIEALLKNAHQTIRDAFLLALHTGQRQGDLLKMTWSAFDGSALTIRQSKGRRKVYIPCTAEIKMVLRRLKAERVTREKAKKPISTTILVNRRGRPWTSDGFRTMFDRAKDEAGIEDRTFHDLRGTFVTRMSELDVTPQKIATITGHSVAEVQRIIDAYLARTPEMAKSAMKQYEKGTKSGNRGGNWVRQSRGK